jgi:hypothetical protein
MKKVFLLFVCLFAGLSGRDNQRVGLSSDQYEDFKDDVFRMNSAQKRRQLLNGATTSLKEEVYYGLGVGLSGGISKGMHAPISMLLNRFLRAVLSPAATAESIRRSIFLTVNDSLSYEKLARWSRWLSQSVTNNMIDPANSSNKVLRRALLKLDDQESQVTQDIDEHVFGINFVVNLLNSIKYSVNRAISIYSDSPISMKLLRPYSSDHVSEIVFLSRQLVEQVDQFIRVSQSIKDISQLTDRKDEIQKYLKNITSLFQDLGILVDPDTVFDSQYKGLKLLPDQAARGRSLGQGNSGGMPSGF